MSKPTINRRITYELPDKRVATVLWDKDFRHGLYKQVDGQTINVRAVEPQEVKDWKIIKSEEA